jgi:catechol 2,3-dioxygenase
MSSTTLAIETFELRAAPMRIGKVRLKVRDLARVSRFYQHVLGLRLINHGANRMTLGTASAPLLDLVGDPGLVRRDPRSAGLFHTAILLPSRPDLARWLAFVMEQRVPLHGASDHGVSEAIYLADPEGNGIEVYADRPASEWRPDGGQLDMPSDPLDLHDLLRAASGSALPEIPEASVIGHVHLQVGDLPAAERLYRDVLGFDVTCRYPGGSFFGAGGYHHQLAANTWNSRGAGPRSHRTTGLDGFELVIKNGATRAAIEARAREAGFHVSTEKNAASVQDPWGLALTLTS